MEETPETPQERYAKTPKGKAARNKAIANYRKTEAGKLAEKKYRQSPQGKAAIAEAGRRYRERMRLKKLGEGGQE